MSDNLRPRRQRGYPARDRLDASSAMFRRSLARLGREAEREPGLGEQLAEIISAACAELDRLAAVAEKAVASSPRHQARLRREIAKAEALLRQMPADRRGSLEADLADLRAVLVTNS
jgi:hypothetical protein